MTNIRFGALALAAATALAAQAPVGISSRANSGINTGIIPATPSMEALKSAGEPLLGFATDAEGVSLYTVLGTGRRPRFGSSVPLPAGTAKLYLPPLQKYAVVEISADGSLSVWTLKDAAPSTENTQAIRGALTHPGLVAFSPSGESLAICTGERLQIITGLPFQPRILHEISTQGRIPSALAVADDGQLVLAQFDDQTPFYSVQGRAWEPVPAKVRPQAWVFLPHSHEIVVSDSVANAIVLLSAAGEAPDVQRVLASHVTAYRLAVTSDADQVTAASSTGAVWEISLAVGAVPQRLQLSNVSALSTLRDGHAFLFSSFPNLTILRATASELHAGH